MLKTILNHSKIILISSRHRVISHIYVSNILYLPVVKDTDPVEINSFYKTLLFTVAHMCKTLPKTNAPQLFTTHSNILIFHSSAQYVTIIDCGLSIQGRIQTFSSVVSNFFIVTLGSPPWRIFSRPPLKTKKYSLKQQYFN